MTAPETLRFENETLILIDQTLLPQELTYFHCQSVAQTFDAIKRLVVRGAPAIGIAAAYGVCLTAPSSDQGHQAAYQPGASQADYLAAIDYLATSRPTAVNLFWALDRMREIVETTALPQLRETLLSEARAIHEHDRTMCHAIGRHGAGLLQESRSILTHCNAGGLATSTWGTALAPIYCLQEQGRKPKVFADETRPLLQGGRLTAWELSQAGVDVTVITDSMAGSLMRLGKIDAVIVGADRISASGDVANKIGTYPVAVLAKHHGLPFYVAAPSNTFDLKLMSGDDIPIEQRDRDEVAAPYGIKIVPDQASVLNAAFDVTPASYVDAIITEQGIIAEPNAEKIAEHFASASAN